jgi:hypothetical protein
LYQTNVLIKPELHRTGVCIKVAFVKSSVLCNAMAGAVVTAAPLGRWTVLRRVPGSRLLALAQRCRR